jgi:acetylornithine deacetylase/succinyl-diaminopimelate desuccinylase-like protein
VHVAHTDEEHVRIADLDRAVEDYAKLAKWALAQS